MKTDITSRFASRHRGRGDPQRAALSCRPELPLAEREAPGVEVHLGDADEPQRGREAEARRDRTLAQQVRQLVPLLQADGGVVEHPAVQVARLLDFQLVDVAAEPHELPGQLLVLQAHVSLVERERERERPQSHSLV